MKYFQYTILPFFLLTLAAMGQTSPSADQNYVRQINYQTAMEQQEVEGLSDQDPLNNDKKIESIVYYDGLGRPKQSIAVRAGGSREDLVTPIQYDMFGRQPKDWLPYPELDNNGEFIVNVTTPLLGYYYYQFPESLHPYNNNPYSEKRFEASPLNRVLEQGAPGEDWRINPDLDTDHTIKFGYEFNSGSEVWNFYVNYENGFNDPQLRLDGTYSVNTLSRNVTKDENWQPSDGATGTVVEFSNKQGQILLKRQIAKDANNQSYNLDTYYIYDDFGNLTYVLSPEGSAQIVSNNQLISGAQIILDKLCYQYRYDHRNRLIWKKIPGKGEERVRYDSLDRPVLTQDANFALANQWLFTKYDALNRVAYTGIYSPPLGLDVEQEFLQHTTSAVSENRTLTATTIGGKDFFYTNTAYPTASSYMEILTINYYDDYEDYTVTNGPILAPPTSVMGVPTTENINSVTTTQGLPTVTWAKVLGSGNPGMWITTVTAYDMRGRAVYVDSYNQYLHTQDISRSLLEPISGRVTETLVIHKKTGEPDISTRDYFSYDHMGRLLSHKQKIGSSPLQLITENQYDELGQLVRKDVGGETEFDGYTLLTLAHATYDGTLTKTGGMDSWDSGGKTKGKVVGNGGINFTVVQEDKLLRAGLLKTTSTNDSWTTGYDYGLYFINTDADSDGHKDMKAIVNGVEQTTIYEYDEGDSFSIGRTGTSVIFKKNGTPFLTISNQQTTPGLVGKVSFKSPSAQVTALALYGGNIDKKLQNVDYEYNIRGWLTNINDIEASSAGSTIGNMDLFNFRINYNTVEGDAVNDPLYNGNIAQTIWKTANTDKQLRGYAYTYDDLNRITNAQGSRGTVLSGMVGNTEFSVENIAFDRNGNILSLTRRGANENTTPSFGIWDDLTYTYNGNRLMKVVDNPQPTSHKAYGFKDGINSGDDYLYDDNGNMVKDNNKGIESITYNHLNLPSIIRFDPGSSLTNSISYIYDATGNKLAKILNDNNAVTTTHYDGGYIYSDIGSSGNVKLQFLSHPEGYVVPVAGTSGSVAGFDTGTGTGTQSAYSYVFQYKDHLGNVRLSYSDLDLNGAIDPNTEILQERNYYPFGLQHRGYNNTIVGTENNYQTFQGQEEEKELGKNTYAFQWRDYDPAIGRFNKIDRFAEKYFDQSPYNFTKNSPMVFTEVKGDSIKVSFRTGFLGIFGKKETLTYDSKNQQWNDANGKQYTGKTSKFADRVLGDLKTNQKNELGNEIVTNLSNDNIDHFVKKGSPNSNTINDVNIYYNGSVSDDGQKIYQNGKSGSSPGYVVLGHEMAHKYSRNLGVRNVPWFGAGTADARGVDEYNAMYYENVLRGANGLPLRRAYTENNGNLQGTILDASGNLQSPPTLLSTQSAPTMPAVHAVLIINQILNRF